MYKCFKLEVLRPSKRTKKIKHIFYYIVSATCMKVVAINPNVHLTEGKYYIALLFDNKYRILFMT